MDVRVNCSASGLVYLSAALVYSSPDGRITATTLTNGLQLWLLSQENPSILVNGVTVLLNKQCIPQLNNATQRSCIQHLTPAVTQETETAVVKTPSYTISVVGGFLEGLASGVVITILFVIAALIIAIW